MEWSNPLYLAQRLLLRAVAARAQYAHGSLLDVGCGSSPYRHVFSDGEGYVGLDLPPNGRSDVHGDARALPFRNASFGTVLCNQVLEHVPEPTSVMAEVARVLEPSGVLLLTTPQTWGLHLIPHDYYRFTRYGLDYLATSSGLEVIEVVPTCGVWATLAQRLADTVIHTYAVAFPPRVITLLSMLLAPVLYGGYALDRLSGGRGDPLDHVLVARKPPRSAHA